MNNQRTASDEAPPSAYAGDADTIAALRAGDSAAAHTLYEKYFDELRWSLTKKLANGDAAEECASEAFTKVLEIIRRGKGPDNNFRGYLHAAGFRTMSDWVAQQRSERNNTVIDQFDEHAELSHYHQDDLVVSDIVAALATLPEPEQKLLSLRFVEEQRTTEISEQLGIPNGMLRTQIYRAKHKLRAAYLHQIALARAESAECATFSSGLAAHTLTPERALAVELREHLNACDRCERTVVVLRERAAQFTGGALVAALSIHSVITERDAASAASAASRGASAGTAHPVSALSAAAASGVLPVIAVVVGASVLGATLFFGKDVLAGKHDNGSGAAAGTSETLETGVDLSERCELNAQISDQRLQVWVLPGAATCEFGYSLNGTWLQEIAPVPQEIMLHSAERGRYELVLRTAAGDDVREFWVR